MKQLKKKHIGLYARVSTETQKNGYSIQGKLNQRTEYGQFQVYEVVDEYTDRGISGKTMERPELQRMLKDAND
ncbi:recombinase family protein, partial [Staphylococcus haemolyticus]|uniref:recombinase family protein n=1 Tax=Staphylococcus haemolyticus TaxID=1283 RepID=UPI0015D7074F